MHKSHIVLILIIICLLGANFGLFKFLKKYYALYIEAIVFPDHRQQFHIANLKLGKSDDTRIVLLGDSRIRYWVDFPKIPDQQVLNRGIPGETSSQLLQRFHADSIAIHSKVVVIQAGINDLTAIGVLPHRQDEITDQCIHSLTQIVEALLHEEIHVVLLTIIPPDQPKGLRRIIWNDEIENAVSKVNRYWLNYETNDYLHVIDSRAVLSQTNGNWHADIFADTVHLAPAGYAYLNGAISDILKTLR